MGKLTSTIGQVAPVLSAAGGVLGAVPSIVSAVGTLAGAAAQTQSRDLRAEQDLALRQLRQRQAAELAGSEAQAALDRQKMATDAQASDDLRRSALRRAVARQRASFGVQGVGSSGGSAQAVLLGLFDESDSERQNRERLDAIRSAALDQNLSQTKRINVLQAAQLAERQKFQRELMDS